MIVELRRREYDEEMRSRMDDRALEHQNNNTVKLQYKLKEEKERFKETKIRK